MYPIPANSRDRTRTVSVNAWQRRGILRVCTPPLLFLGFATFLMSGAQQSQPEPASTGPRHVWLDEGGQPVEFGADEEIESFLSEARVVSMTTLSEGITGARRVVLERDGIRMRAIFRDVMRTKERVMPRTGRTLYFRDDCIFERAAYRLSQLLGLHTIPPVVQRTIDGKPGTLQIWIEKGRSDKERKRAGLTPPDLDSFERQYQAIQFFDNLIYSEDRNAGNILVEPSWKMWMIDHTRAFRRWKKLPQPEKVQFCERGLWDKLHTLDETEVRERLKDLLKPSELEGLMERHGLLVAHIQKLIVERGEGQVLYKWR